MRLRTKVLLHHWDTLLALVAAAVLSVLSALDVMDGDPVAASVLAVLALLSVTLVKEREGRDRLMSSVLTLGTKIDQTNHGVSMVQEHMQIWVREIPASEIGPALEAAMEVATFWRFRGGTGTYLRAETLPRLSEGRLRRRDVWIEIIDPRDLDVCQRYADYRRRLKAPRSLASRPEEWSQQRVRIEAYATIVAALWFGQHCHLDVHLALSKQMTPWRHELSSQLLIMNNEQAQRALLADAGSATYDCAYEELLCSFGQARPVDLGLAGKLPTNGITSRQVRTVLRRLDVLPAGERLSNEMCSLILYYAISEAHAVRLGFTEGGARNPYAARPCELENPTRMAG